MPVVTSDYQYQGIAHRRAKGSSKAFIDVDPGTVEALADTVRDVADELRKFTATSDPPEGKSSHREATMRLSQAT
jgi:hypothetical protein